MIPYQVTRSDLAGATMLPNYFASRLAAMEAAVASCSLDAAHLLIEGGDGKVVIERNGDFVKLFVADKPFIIYAVERVELANAETEEIILSMDPPR